MNATPGAADATVRQPFLKTLYFRVNVRIVAGVAVGVFFPSFAQAMKPLGDGFIKLIRMMIAPIIFFSVVVGKDCKENLRTDCAQHCAPS